MAAHVLRLLVVSVACVLAFPIPSVASRHLFQFVGNSSQPQTNATQPIVTSIFPPSGVTNGGFSVSLFGTSFVSTPSGPPSIRIGQTSCVTTAFVSSSALNCIAPAGVGKLLPIAVSTANISAIVGMVFSYVGPQLYAADPSLLPINERTTIALKGVSLGGGLLPAAILSTFNFKNGTARAFPNAAANVTTHSDVVNVTFDGRGLGEGNVSIQIMTGVEVSNVVYAFTTATSEPIIMTVPGTVETFNATSFKSKLKDAIGCDSPDQIFIRSVTSGSVVVNFVLLPNPTNPTSSVASVVSSLVTAAANGNLNSAVGATGSISIGSTTIPIAIAGAITILPERFVMPDYVTALIFIGTFVVAISAAFCAIKIRNMQVARKSLEMQRSVRNLTANLQYGQGALPHIKQV